MSNDITPGKRVLVKARPEDRELTPGIVQEVVDRDGFPGLAHHQVIVLVNGETVTRPMPEVKLATQDTDPAAWMLHDGKTSKHAPGVQETGLEHGCSICQDPEFAQMGLPLCRPCPECQRQGRGSGHIPADDSKCDVCEYEDGPDDYPQPAPVPPFKAVVHADVTIPEQEMRPGEDTVITVPEDCTIYGVQIWDSSDPSRPIHWIAVSKTLRLGDSLHVPGTLSVTEG